MWDPCKPQPSKQVDSFGGGHFLGIERTHSQDAGVQREEVLY